MRRVRGAALLGRDLAVDLGTSTTLVHQQGRGVVLDQPTLVALDTGSGRLVAAGDEAHAMLGRTPSRVVTRRPLRAGVITDADVAEQMLQQFLAPVTRSRLVRPRMVVCVPSEVTGVERRALEDAALRCGARRVSVIEGVLAAAIGADLPVHEPTASMVIDVGGGTTEVAVISLGGVVTARSLRVAGDELDEAIIQGVKDQYDLLLGERSAEDIKRTVAAAAPLPEQLSTRVRGRDLGTGLPRTATLGSSQVREMIEPVISRVVGVVGTVLDRCPPELAGDLLGHGAVLTGGSALLRGLDQRLERDLGISVAVATDPRRTVVRGVGSCVEDAVALERVLASAPVW